MPARVLRCIARKQPGRAFLGGVLARWKKKTAFRHPGPALTGLTGPRRPRSPRRLSARLVILLVATPNPARTRVPPGAGRVRSAAGQARVTPGAAGTGPTTSRAAPGCPAGCGGWVMDRSRPPGWHALLSCPPPSWSGYAPRPRRSGAGSRWPGNVPGRRRSRGQSHPRPGPRDRGGRRDSSAAATGWPGPGRSRTRAGVTRPGRRSQAGPRVTSPGRPGRHDQGRPRPG